MKVVNCIAVLVALLVSQPNAAQSQQDERATGSASRAEQQTGQSPLPEPALTNQSQSDSSRVSALIRQVRDGKTPAIRVQAIGALRQLWDHDRFPRIFDVLFEVRHDSDPAVRDAVFLMFAEHQRLCRCTINSLQDSPFQPCRYRHVVKGTPPIGYERDRVIPPRSAPTEQVATAISSGVPAGDGDGGPRKPGRGSNETPNATRIGPSVIRHAVGETNDSGSESDPSSPPLANDIAATAPENQEPDGGLVAARTDTNLVSLLETVTDGVSDCLPEACVATGNREFWEHQSSLVGDFLYLSPFGVDTLYGLAVDGIGASAVPTGSTAVADPAFRPGFRVGGSHRLSDVSSLTATFWHYEGNTRSGLDLPGGTGFVNSEIVHPNTLNVASDSLSATANYGIDFQMVDVAYRRVLRHGDHYAINGSIGLRYANLDQDLNSTFSILGATMVNTEIDYDGVGPRIGLDAELELDDGWLLYGQGAASFLTGEFRGTYRQDNVLTGPLASVDVSDDRIVSQLELELGFGWRNQEGTFGIFSGYYVGSWLNTMTTSTLIDAVQTNDFDNMDETLGFGGLTARVELRY